MNKNSNFAVTVANGEKVMAQLTKPLPVCLHNRICNMQFVALPNNNKDIIVGLDLITYFGLTLDCANKSINFPSESIVCKVKETNRIEHVGLAETLKSDVKRIEALSQEKNPKSSTIISNHHGNNTVNFLNNSHVRSALKNYFTRKMI